MSTIQENKNSYQHPVLDCFLKPGVESSSVLAEIENKTQSSFTFSTSSTSSCSLKRKKSPSVQTPQVLREVQMPKMEAEERLRSIATNAAENEGPGFDGFIRNPFQNHPVLVTRVESSLISEEIDNKPQPFFVFSSISTSSLKRKRPPKLQIPQGQCEIYKKKAAANRECREKNAADKEGSGIDGDGFGVFFIKGKKKASMEDAHKIVSNLNGDSKKGFFGVYDGHGGRMAADFITENLHSNILGMMEKHGGDTAKGEATKAGYLKTDQDFLKQGLSSGACCVTCLIEDDIVVSNLGDCRAVLCRGGIAEALTVDHSAGREDERKRIEEKGGYVGIHHGTWRVEGILAVTRSIGDAHLKEWLLAEPDTKVLPLTSDMEFLILASDGLWEKVGNQEAVDTARNFHLNTNKLETKGFLHLSKDQAQSPDFHLNANNLKAGFDLQKEVGESVCENWNVGEDENGFGCENTSPRSKRRRTSLSETKVVPHISKDQAPSLNFHLNAKNLKTGFDLQKEVGESVCENWKAGVDENGFGCENTSPRSKRRQTSLSIQQKLKAQCLKQGKSYKNGSASGGLMAVCKELVSLAALRGSLDDITVMIIDLKHFRHD